MSLHQTFLIADDTVITDHLSTSTAPYLVIKNVLRCWTPVTPATKKGYALAQCFSNNLDFDNFDFDK